MVLSIRLHRCVVYGVEVPFFVGRVSPGHHTSAPNVATGAIHESMAVTIGPGAALRRSGLSRRMCWAALRAFPHQVATWCLKVRRGSR